MNMQKIELDQLPTHSTWPSRLLGLEEFGQRTKTKDQIDREFGREKWGSLLGEIRKDPAAWNLSEADNFFLKGSESVLSIKDDIYVSSSTQTHQYFVNEIERHLSPYLPARVLVELGAGYGSTILNLAKRNSFSGARVFAAEYTETGISCLDHLSAAENIELESGHCVFDQPTMCKLAIPKKSLIYTCMAVHYVPVLRDFFVDNLIKLQPAVVVHFEPCIEHYGDSLLGMLRQKYVRLNDYNRNLLSLLRQRETLGHIRILTQEACFFGENCLLPCSCIAWSPIS